MKLKMLNCPGCGGALEVEDGLDLFYCKFCGYKIVMTGMSDAAYKAKTKFKEFEHQKEAKEREYRNDHDVWRREEESKDREFKRERNGWIIGISFYLLLMGILFGMAFIPDIGRSVKEHKLNDVVSQIEEDMEEGDYEHAMLLTNRLRVDGDESDDIVEKWDECREEYIRQIKAAQKGKGEVIVCDMPFGAEDSEEYTKSEALAELKKAGFINVKAKQVKGSAGFFKESNLVKRITVDGEDEFEAGDGFDEDVRIIVFYYES